jgi:hypothetical protein
VAFDEHLDALRDALDEYLARVLPSESKGKSKAAAR